MGDKLTEAQVRYLKMLSEGHRRWWKAWVIFTGSDHAELVKNGLISAGVITGLDRITPAGIAALARQKETK